MLVKTLFSSLGCLLAWFVLLPLLAITGGITLFVYAVLAEIGSRFAGRPAKSLDPSAAREIARRICMGYSFNRS
jgi:hypothetical protein